MADTKGVFTATMSYHRMLKKAQELNPVLLYVLCKMLLEAEVREGSSYVETQQISGNCNLTDYFANGHMERFVKIIFNKMTVEVDEGENSISYVLSAYTHFVVWLKGLPLTVDDKTRSVTIPA